MLDDDNPKSLPTPNEDAPTSAPAAEEDAPAAPRQAMPPNALDDPEIDMVDFQSMQSFPASDPPAWSRPFSGPAINQADPPDSQ
jgi:hypothetical protein